MKTNYHIGIMGNLFSGRTTLMTALAAEPYRSELATLLGNAEVHAFSERVDKGSLTDRCLALFYADRVANIFSTETAFLNMRTQQQREIRHLMTRANPRGVLVIEDRPFLDGPEVFVRRMRKSGEMPEAHWDLYQTLFYETLHNERIRLPDLTVRGWGKTVTDPGHLNATDFNTGRATWRGWIDREIPFQRLRERNVYRRSRILVRQAERAY